MVHPHVILKVTTVNVFCNLSQISKLQAMFKCDKIHHLQHRLWGQFWESHRHPAYQRSGKET